MDPAQYCGVLTRRAIAPLAAPVLPFAGGVRESATLSSVPGYAGVAELCLVHENVALPIFMAASELRRGYTDRQPHVREPAQ